MNVNFITKEDLEVFKNDLIEELKKLLNEPTHTSQKRWLRSKNVQEMLGISSGTLQNMRITREIPFTKIGGTLFYPYEEIVKLLETKK